MQYRVLRRLGRGGMGVVDLAVDADGSEVALKRLSLHGTPAEVTRARARIRREAAVLASLDHPGVVKLLDLTDDGDDVVLVMPYLAGGSLHDRVVQHGPLDPQAVADLAGPLLDALAAAHRQGIVHRDIKPENVLFTAEGEPRLVDFGVAWVSDHTPGLTATSMVVGTPGFMAPEQARGEAVGAAADVFSLGATLLYAATGDGPYGAGGTDPRVLMHRAASGRIERPPRELPPALRTMLTAALDRQPARRPSAARLAGGAGGTDPIGGLVRGGRGRLRAAVVVAVVAVVLLAVGAAAVAARRGDRRDEAGGLRAGATTAPTTAVATTAPCRPRRYQPCRDGALAPVAAGTDGVRCVNEREDYDSDRGNGCEARPDGLDQPALLTEDDPVRRATIVPTDDVDRFRLPVDDRLSATCDGRVTITLTAPEAMALQLYVTRDDELLGAEVSIEGRPAVVTVEEACARDDAGELAVRVRPIGSDRTGEDYVLRRDGRF